LAAVFDLVRDVNTAIDRGQFHENDAPLVLAAMQNFDSIFALLTDDDDEKLRRLGFLQTREELTNQEIESLIAERESERRKRNFQRADDIRRQLAGRGIILEDVRDGSVRWKKK
ncbi:MAG: CysS/YqeB C-terminal domain-containing protein, partial [Candidatus Acidiferrales bacterium]